VYSPFFLISDVNANTSILPNFTLVGVWNNTKCDSGEALASLVWQYDQGVVGIVGAGCSIASTPVAALARSLEVSQISWGSTSPALSVNHTYPFFKRTVVPDTIQAAAGLDIMLHHGWGRIGVFHSQEELHSLLAASFELQVGGREEVEVTSLVSFSPSQTDEELNLQLDKLLRDGKESYYFFR